MRQSLQWPPNASRISSPSARAPGPAPARCLDTDTLYLYLVSISCSRGTPDQPWVLEAQPRMAHLQSRSLRRICDIKFQSQHKTVSQALSSEFMLY